jgi:hypothetical protein
VADPLLGILRYTYFQFWQVCYRILFAGEYYLKGRDECVKSKIEKPINAAVNRALYYEEAKVGGFYCILLWPTGGKCPWRIVDAWPWRYKK